MRVSRRSLLASAAGIAAFSIIRSHPAGAAPFTFKLGHDEPATHPLNIRVVEAAEAIAKETDGQLKIQVYPNSQLGNDTHMLAQLRSGALEFLQIGDNIIANVVPSASLVDLPFAYKDYADFWTTLDGPFGDLIRAQIEKAGLHTLDKGWDGGFRNVFTSNRPINHVSDMKGLKLRVPAAPIQQSLFTALGAAPTPINNNELYSALQTHLVDGAEPPLVNLETAKYYEVSKYVSMTKHQPTSYEMLVNPGAWKRLPKDLQEIATRHFNEAALKQREDIAQGEAALIKQLEGQGQVFTTPDRDSFREAVRSAGLYASWRDSYGKDAFALLEKSVGQLI